MTQKMVNKVLIKFVAPLQLKEDLEQLASHRNITLSALLRIILTEYVRHKG